MSHSGFSRDDFDDELPPPLPPVRSKRYLPLEVVPGVLAFCSLPDFLVAIRVCRAWYDATRNPAAWQSLIQLRCDTTTPLSHSLSSSTMEVSALRAAAVAVQRARKRKLMEKVCGEGQHRRAVEIPPINSSVTTTSSVTSVPPSRGQVIPATTQSARLRNLAEGAATALTVKEELDQAASQFFLGRHPSNDGASVEMGNRPSSMAQLEFLECQQAVLVRRVGNVVATSLDLRQHMTTITSAVETLRSHLVKAEEETLQHSHSVEDVATRALALEAVCTRRTRLRTFCTNAKRIFEKFETAIVRSLVDEYAPFPTGTASVSTTMMTTFLQLELFTLHRERCASLLAVHWKQFKKTFNVDECYYDLKDMVFDFDDRCLSILSTDESQHQQQPHNSMSCDDRMHPASCTTQELRERWNRIVGAVSLMNDVSRGEFWHAFQSRVLTKA